MRAFRPPTIRCPRVSKRSNDLDRIDCAVLALQFLGICERDRFTCAARMWKSFDWDAMNRLHDKGLTSDPVGKAKSVGLIDEGHKRAEGLFDQLFRA